MPLKLFDPLKDGSHSGTGGSSPSPDTSTATSAGKDTAPTTTDAHGSSTPSAPTAGQPFRGIPDSPDPLKRDFRLFLCLIWAFYGWVPTPLQMSLAYYLQWGPDRLIIMAFRGCAKSWITGAYVLWCLYCNPDLKIMVLSGSQKRAVAFTQWCLNLMLEIDELKHLAPLPGQRSSALAFDVAGCKPDQTPSLNALGYNSQTAGWRADIIVPDDVETAQNSLTVLMREKILSLIPEYEAILKPFGLIRFLGTPHSEDSTYVHLYKERGYECRIWPAIYPTPEKMRLYEGRLAGYVRNELKKNPHLAGTPTEPQRFSSEDLDKRRLGSTEAEFALQYLLDTTLADAERYPLKAHNLIVMPLDERRGPDYVVWGMAEDLMLRGLPSLGYSGDYYVKPMAVADAFSEWQATKAFIDTTGRGRTEGHDEASLTVTSLLHATVYLRFNAGYIQGYSPETLRAMAASLVHYSVQTCTIESNFGDGMFLSLFRPYVEQAWEAENKKRRKGEEGGTDLDEVRAVNVQKELRILSILEPAIAQHRVVVDQQVITKDYQSVLNYQGRTQLHFSLFYQMTHLSREPDSLKKDDRVDSFAGAVGLYAEELGLDPIGLASVAADERLQDDLERLLGDVDELGIGGNLPPSSNRVAAAGPRKR